MERQSEPMEEVLAEKAYAAERGLALQRVLIVFAGWCCYPLMDKTGTVPWLAYLLLSLSTVYAMGVALLKPRARRRSLPSTTATVVSDAAFVMLWLYATGGIHSPYMPVLMLGVIAVGIRLTPRDTLLAIAAFAGGYAVLLWVMGQLGDNLILAALRIFYICMSGLMGWLVSGLVLEQLVAKVELQKRLKMEERLSSSEAALAEAQAIAQTGSWNWEFATDQHTWSAELYRIMGRTPGEPVRHEDFLQGMHAEEQPLLHAALGQARADQEAFHGEYRLVRPSGELRWVHLKGKVVKDGLGQPVRMSGTLQDITERKEMERRLMVADRMAALGTLAGGIAHEINNPLTYITTNLAFLEENLSTSAAKQNPALEELRGAVSDAREGANRVRHIVRDLKAFSRVDESRPQPVDVRKGLEFSFNVAAPEIRARAQLVRDFQEVPLVLGDETRLGQVFLNLLVNAAQAIPEGNPEAHSITVRTRRGEPGQVVVEISDTGGGIPPANLERIFEPFFTTKPAGVGTGLGLSICHGIVTSLGGRISVQSAVGRGTTFTVTLPATEAAQVVAPQAAPVVASPQRARVLIVDDEPMVAASLSRPLRAEYRVTTATGPEALRRVLEGEDFDVIVCDLAMPDISGMDLHARLKEQRHALADRMIFLTGGAFTQKAEEFLAQTRYWLEKPVDLATLRKLLQEVVEQAQLIQ
ncbi:hybrid sensor histidine kinase/response regulator [Hyalangium versicolor]|uniref:hybrid sensor histidine kinase/response regulator n=1 Tax=Hyalangium versicolor TaxID=2861190 RepID=UPI001CCED3A2|nr:ATP-binding protein [Hyalangium versicolor]